MLLSAEIEIPRTFLIKERIESVQLQTICNVMELHSGVLCNNQKRVCTENIAIKLAEVIQRNNRKADTGA